MRRWRKMLRRCRLVVLVVLATAGFYSVEGYHYAEAVRLQREHRERLTELAGRLDLPVERLESEEPGLAEAVGRILTDEDEAFRRRQLERLEGVLARHREQVASNPYRDEIEAVREAYRLHRLDGTLRELFDVTTLDGVRDLSGPARRAVLRNLAITLEEEVALPSVTELPPEARGRRNRLQATLEQLAGRLRAVLARPGALSDEALSETLGALRAAVDGEVGRGRRSRGPRFTDRPLPLRRAGEEMPVAERGDLEEAARDGAAPGAGVEKVGADVSGSDAAAGTTLAPELEGLLDELGPSPARIFRWVHDHVRFDPKWGQVRSPRGTYLERTGTAWDQAVLLQALLRGAGVEADLAWGEVEVPIDLLTNLLGTEDPQDAGAILATGGTPGTLIAEGGPIVAARISHPWVVAALDYLPDRGVRPVGPDTVPDSRVRMDPSLKRMRYQEGLDVAKRAPFSLGEYLASGTSQSPRRFFEDRLAAFNESEELWKSLEEVKRSGEILEEGFPFVPGTLRGKVVSVVGEVATVPEALVQGIRLEARTPPGELLLAWDGAAPALYGERLEVAYRGATPEDEQTLAEHGGVFETPPYLVDLVPEVRVDGAVVATGEPVGSATGVEIRVTHRPAGANPSTVTHDTLAGERHVVALDLGRMPRTIVEEHLEALEEAVAAGDGETAEAERLFLLGATYMHALGRDLGDIAGWTWQRLVRLGTEALVSQSGAVSSTLGGTPLTFERAERFVDVGVMPLGVFPADGDERFRRAAFELMGAQGSFLEGQVFEEVLERRGIAAVSALTRARREGQAIRTVDSGNVDSVLEAVALGEAVEAEVRAAVERGRIARVAESPVTVDRWSGSGYVLEDPETGEAAYLLSGGLAGGSETGGMLGALREVLGSEEWLEGGPLAELLGDLLGLLDGQGQGGGVANEEGPAAQQSDPVNVATGNLWFTETDLAIQSRGLQVVWSRTYNSRSGRDGPLGFGWSFTYGDRLERQLDGTVVYREADGTEHPFQPDGDGGYEAAPGRHLTLTTTTDGFQLRLKDGVVLRFAADGRMLSVSEPNGNVVTLGYDAEGHLATVTDAAGRTVLTLTSDADGRITEVRDLTGRSIAYTYDGADLVAVNDAVGQTWRYAYDAEHNLIARSDPLSNTDRYAYDGFDRCYRHTDPLGHTEHFAYTSRGRRAVVTGRRGFESFFELDERGRAVTEVDPLGNISHSTWDAANNRLTTTDPRGGVSRRTFDERGNMLSETDALGNTTTLTYGAEFNSVTSTTDATGHTVENRYDAAGNLIEIRQVVDGESLVEKLDYDGLGQLVARTDAEGHTTRFAWDDTTGALTRHSDALGDVTAVETDSVGRVTGVTDPQGHRVRAAWDGRDRMVRAKDSFGNEISLRFDEAGRREAMTTPRGTTTFTRDAIGRPVAVTDPLGNTIRTEYDAAGNAVTRIDAKGQPTSTRYDALGRPIAVIDPLGAVTSSGYVHDVGSGRCAPCGEEGASVSTVTDALGNTTERHFDVLGRLAEVTDSLGNTTEMAYDAKGRRTSETDALGRTTRFEYDGLGRITAVVEANGARTEYTHDASGNLTNLRDAEGRDWSRSYDALDRLIAESDPLGNTTRLEYDELSNLIRKVKPDGEVLRFEYDVKRRTAVVLPDGSRERFTYDALGRRTGMDNDEVAVSFSYDRLDRVTSVTDHTLEQTLAYEYDANGNRVAMDGPKGRVVYLYDAKNRLVEQRDPATGTYRFGYDALDRRTELAYPNGVVTESEYDAAGRLLSILTRNAEGQVVDGHTYSYDAVGNRTAMRSLRQEQLHEYTYDAVDRLTRWQRGSERFEAYSYDQVGNRLRLDDERGTVTYAYDEADRLLEEIRGLTDGTRPATTYTWDPSGNLIEKTDEGGSATTYTWDALDRLRVLEDSSGKYTYGYNPEGIRVRQSDPGTTQRFLHAGEDILATYTSGSIATYYAHGPGIDEPLARLGSRAGSRQLAYLHRDGSGSVTATSDVEARLSATTSYAAFGQVEQRTGPERRYGFTSRELDPTGLMYYRARYYQPEVGRFVSPDPQAGRPSAPPSFYGYAYARLNPNSFSDPSGRQIAGIVSWMRAKIHQVATFIDPDPGNIFPYFFRIGFLVTVKTVLFQLPGGNIYSAIKLALHLSVFAVVLLPAIDLMVNPSFYVDSMLSGVKSPKLRIELRGTLQLIVQAWGVLTTWFAYATLLADIRSWSAFGAYVFLTLLWYTLWQDPSLLPRTVDRALRRWQGVGLI